MEGFAADKLTVMKRPGVSSIKAGRWNEEYLKITSDF